MSLFPLKPTHAPVKAYYAALAQFHLHGHKTEGNTRSAFADLLKKCASPYDWHLIKTVYQKVTSLCLASTQLPGQPHRQTFCASSKTPTTISFAH